MSRLLMGVLLLLAACAVITNLTVRATFVEYRDASSTALTANKIFEDILQAKIASLKWQTAGDSTEIESFEENAADLSLMQKEISENGTIPEVLRQQADRLRSDLIEYESAFRTMTEARQRFEEIASRTRELGRKARQELSDIVASAAANGNAIAGLQASRALEALMLGRLYIERYVNSASANDRDRIALEMKAAFEAVALLQDELTTPQLRAKAVNVIETLNALDGTLNSLEVQLQAEATASSELDLVGQKIANDTDSIIEETADLQDILGPRALLVSLWSSLLVCMIAGSSILLGWFSSKRVSSRITEGIEDALGTMARIADGDLETEVRNTEYENEIGRIARALEVFKENGQRVRDAAERERAAEEERFKSEAAHREERAAQMEAMKEKIERERAFMIDSLSSSLGKVVSAAVIGDFSHRVDSDFTEAAFVALATDVNALLESVETGLAEIGDTLNRVAKGDLTTGMNGNYQGAFKSLQNDTNEMVAALKTLLLEITESGANLSTSSSELRDTSASLSKQAEENAAALEETSAAIEELTASIKQVSDNVTDANENARVASETAKSSSEIAASAADAMARLSEASSEITRVVGVIDDISFQINLLALNAGVEASRAGDAGRGFSVVASEVRSLAQRASEAAKEISKVICKSEAAVTEGVEKVSNARRSLEQISETVVGVSQRIDEVSNAISEQANGVSEINVAISRIDQNTQKQAASFEEVTAASGLLSGEADGLKRSISRFDMGASVVTFKHQDRSDPKDEGHRPPHNLSTSGSLALEEQDWEDF
ncbi:MAG: methyl-accepting chemotaxis protein [Pseudomonadota bacterium]